MPGEVIPSEQLNIVPLNRGIDLSGFDCKDGDLNDFLKNDAFAYEQKNLVKTYVCLFQNKPVGFFSACTDAIRLSPDERRGEFGKDKTHPDYPAVKIARLAVSCDFQKRGVGRLMVRLVVGKGSDLSKTIGCRFVTVDAYPQQAEFYERMGFMRNLADRSGDNISMRLDLIQP